MKCSQCGQTIPEGSRFCVYCGAAVQSGSPPVEKVVENPPSAVSQTRQRAGISIKTLVIILLAGFVLFAGIIVAVWFYFFPPAVYVIDRFSSAHREIESQIKNATTQFQGGQMNVEPPAERYYAFLYKTPASDHATIEATALWNEGDEQVQFGIVCCASDDRNLLSFKIEGDGHYKLSRLAGDQWYAVIDWSKLPDSIPVTKKTPYLFKMVIEGEYLSMFLNDVLLAKILQAEDHRGRFGILAQAGKNRSVLSFDHFKAKKNSLFQKD